MAENYFGITDTGKFRDNNEDAFIAQKLPANSYILACVIDGVGGYEGGEVAAAITRKAVLQHLNKPLSDVKAALKEAFIIANETLFIEKQKNQKYSNMACVATLAMADVQHNVFYYAHVGDTRLYLLRDNSLVKVTKDQSFVGFLEDSGRLTEKEAMTHPKRNEINKGLGFEQINSNSDYIETGESPFLPGDSLLLCSDGLTDMVGSSEITTILTQDTALSQKGKALVEAANAAGGKDNITVVLVYNNTVPVKQRATKPASLKKKPVEQVEAIPDDKKAAIEEGKPVAKPDNSKTIILLLSAFCALLVISCLWLLLRQPKKDMLAAVSKKESPDSIKKKSNPREVKLLDTLYNAKEHTLLLTDSLFTTPLNLSHSLFIKKDSLVLQGKNDMTFVSDSAFSGPAIIVASTCKYVLLDAVTLENFDIGILSQNKALHLKNVRFKNCRVPVQYQFQFPESQYVNGSLADKAFFQWDSIPKKNK